MNMTEPKRMGNPNWSKGMKPQNPNGRPKGAKSGPRSKLRKTLDKLREIEDKALENIKDSVEGKEVDKEVLATSKFVVTTIVTVNRAAVADEESKKMLDDDEDNAPSIEEEKPKPTFSLNIVTPS